MNDQALDYMDDALAKSVSGIAVTEPPADRRDTEAILYSRALALAEEVVTESETASLDVLEFRLAEETYGIESSFVREVYPLKDFTPLPCTPPFVLGITSVRGQVFSIIDLHTFFGLQDRSDTDPSLVIIVQSGDMQVAILVDSILDVRSLPLSDLQPALPALVSGCAPYMRGVTSDRVTLLDTGKLLADPKVIVGKEAEEN